MGRGSDTLQNFEGRYVHLRRVPMVDGDYDPGGTYWGGYPAPPLFCVWTKDGEVIAYLRAESKEAAMRQLPNDVKFYKERKRRGR